MFLRKLILSVTLMLALILTAGASGSAQAQGGTPTPTLPPAPEICSADQKVIADVEAGATVSFWTLSLSPTFDSYLADVFARFEKTYGVKVNWTDVPFGEAQTRYRNALAAGNAPDVINLSGGWVPEFAEAGQILSMDQNVPEAVRKDYFEGAYTGYNVNGESYQVPWYLSIQFMMVNKQILTDAGLSEKDIPKNFEELAKVSRTVKEKTKRYGFAPNLLEGDTFLKLLAGEGVPILKDGKAAFNTPEGAAVLQYYVDLVKEDVIPKDITTLEHRKMLDRFSAGEMAFVFTGPQLARLINENNPATYKNLLLAPLPVGKAGGVDLGVMSLVVTKATKTPKAAVALATFVTNSCNMVLFSKIVPIYPSSAGALKDPFFQKNGEKVEESARVPAAQSLPTAKVLVPTLPQAEKFKEEVNKAVANALLGQATAQDALDEAVDVINTAIGK